jgi:hypothetical protein
MDRIDDVLAKQKESAEELGFTKLQERDAVMNDTKRDFGIFCLIFKCGYVKRVNFIDWNMHLR